MKPIYLLATISVLTTTLPVYAQTDSSGIYKTSADFRNNHLHFAIDCRTEKHKIKLNDFFGKKYITIIHNDTSYKLNKADIFGYRTCDGSVVRFLGKKELVLLNPGEPIVIYRYDLAKAGKGITNVTNYYFSKDGAAPVLSLTISNVKKAFADNHAFHEKIEAQFKYNTELAAFDDFHKMYKLNWILKMSQQK